LNPIIFTFLSLFMTLVHASSAYADLLSPWHYIKNYNLGVDVGETVDTADVGFDVNSGLYNDPECEPGSNGDVHCIHTYESHQDGFGLFLEQPFKRKGFWHFDYDLNLDVRVVDDKLSYVGEQSPCRVPIQDLRIHLYSLVALPNVKFGITPKNFPDILFSIGPAGELVWGSVNVNNSRHVVSPRGVFRRSSVTNIFSYQQAELVFWRFGKGSASLSWWRIYGDDHVQDGDIMPETVGELRGLSIKLNKTFFGLKVLMK
jgi:hypothetical protein